MLRTASAAVAAMAVVLGLSGCGAGTAEAEGNPEEPNDFEETFDGESDLVSQAAWWEWAAGQPEGEGPVEDADGSNCARSQTEEVWFLAGTLGEEVDRACTIPANQPLVFPAVVLWGEDVECEVFLESVGGAAELDGTDLALAKLGPEKVSFDAAEGNAVTGAGGEHEVYSCGLWVQTEGLSPGEHTLEFYGQADTFANAVEYRLTVTP